MDNYDVVVIGGGPTGATAADDLATAGKRVLLIDRDGRIKPCGGAVPPILIREFKIPESLLEAKVTTARMISPSNCKVDMPVGGWVGMVNRGTFDEWLRNRAASNGATRVTGKFTAVVRDEQEQPMVEYKSADKQTVRVRTRAIIGADGAVSNVAKQCLNDQATLPNVFAYHEIVRSPKALPATEGTESATIESQTTQAQATQSQDLDFDPERCDVFYQGTCSPDFYGWVFPHGEETSIGMGTAVQGFSLRGSVASLREQCGLTDAETVRTEGAPIPLKTRRRWDNGRDVVVSGDAAGAVAPASGEGIYYAMFSGRCAAQAVEEFLDTGNAKALRLARKRFMKLHGRVFFILGIMQKFWYSNDKRRERFVSICKDPDVQTLTWQAYMNKRLVRAKPIAHVRIFFKDMAHLLGMAPR